MNAQKSNKNLFLLLLKMPHKDKKARQKYMREYRRTHPSVRVYFREYQRRVRLGVIAALGGKCASCGHSDVRVLQVDHLSGGGTIERRTFGTNVYKYHRYILANVDSGRYQL